MTDLFCATIENGETCYNLVHCIDNVGCVCTSHGIVSEYFTWGDIIRKLFKKLEEVGL